MSAPVYVPELNGSRIYKVGRVGYETGTQDDGGIYSGILRSEKISPMGETGWCKFRRVALRVRHTSSFTVTMKVYVDGVQTEVYDQTDMTLGTVLTQSVTFTESAPTSPPAETILEMEFSKAGTYIEVQLECDSDDVCGTFLPEEIDVHYVALRPTRHGSASSV